MHCFIVLPFSLKYLTNAEYIAKAPEKKPHLTNSKIKQITSITAVTQYLTDNTFQLYITTVVMHFYPITKRQSTKQELISKMTHKTCDYAKWLPIPKKGRGKAAKIEKWENG